MDKNMEEHIKEPGGVPELSVGKFWTIRIYLRMVIRSCKKRIGIIEAVVVQTPARGEG